MKDCMKCILCCLFLLVFAGSSKAQAPILQFGGSGSGDGQFAEINGLSVDDDGRIYVVDTGNARVQVFDTEGDFLHSFGEAGTGEGEFDFACGIAVNSQAELVYVAEGLPGTVNHRVQAFDLEGVFQFEFGSPGPNEGEFDSPCQMAVGGDGEIFVVDSGNARVQVFDMEGNFLRVIGERGAADGQFSRPSGIAVQRLNTDRTGKIFVADSFAARVQAFDADGNFLYTFGSFGAGDGEFNRACHLALFGLVYIADAANERIQAFDLDGNFHAQLSPIGSEPSRFCSNVPLVVATDKLGQIYAEDGNLIKVFTLDSDGDGLLDVWEVAGLDTNGDGIVDLRLQDPPFNADPDHKDLYLEFDWRQGEELTQRAIRAMKRAFCAAPSDAGGVENPDGRTGINLWVDTGSLTDIDGRESPARPCSCGDGIDNDGDGLVDGDDDDCLAVDPTSGEGGAGAVTCIDGRDNDGDGLVDFTDPDCRRIFDASRTETAIRSRTCGDGIDNDGDGLVDTADPDCNVGDDLGGGNELVTGSGSPLTSNICHVNDATFYAAKRDNFDALNRGLVSRYAISGQACDADGDGRADSGGWGEIGGNDFIEYNHDGGTIMHELGHNLNLQHGGNVGANCKPNYVSVMNYDQQFGINQFNGGTIFDFSPPRFAGGRGQAPLPQITENSLAETVIFDTTDRANLMVFTNRAGNKMAWPVNGDGDFDGPGDGDGDGLGDGVDWDGDGTLSAGPLSVNVDTSGASGNPAACTNAATNSVLTGYDDWANVALNFRQFGDADDGAINPVLEPEPTLEQMQELQRELHTTDLSIEKWAPLVVEVGDEFTYQLSILNRGPRTANRLSVEDRLPAPVDFRTASDGCTTTSASRVSCEYGPLPAQQAFTVEIRVDTDRACAGGVPVALTNTASVANIAEFAGADLNDIDNTASLTLTPVDSTEPAVSCNSPATITPPDAPTAFTATAADLCDPDPTIVIGRVECFAFTKNGKKIDKSESCIVSVDGATVTVTDSGGVGDRISWEVTASDGSGNMTEQTCQIQVVNPGRGRGR